MPSERRRSPSTASEGILLCLRGFRGTAAAAKGLTGHGRPGESENGRNGKRVSDLQAEGLAVLLLRHLLGGLALLVLQGLVGALAEEHFDRVLVAVDRGEVQRRVPQ